MTGRKLRDPDSYTTAIEAAESLRDVAKRIEDGGGMIRYSLTVSFATEQDVEEAYKRRAARKTNL